MFGKNNKKIINIAGMHCQHCANKVKETLQTIPGIDKVKVYHNNKLLAEQWVGGASLTWYFKECETLKPYNEQTIQEISISIEGCLSEIVVCEIILF